MNLPFLPLPILKNDPEALAELVWDLAQEQMIEEDALRLAAAYAVERHK